MAKKKLADKKRENAAIDRAYDLHIDAIDDLVGANEENSPGVKEEEIKKYRKDILGKLPVFIKALFIKFWFNGAICYFIFFGLVYYIQNMLDRLVVLAVGMGFINDLLVKNILLYFDNGNGYADWTLFPYKRYWTLFANVVYSFVLTAFVVIVYFGINYLINGAEKTVFEIRVEPVLFALINLLGDLMFIGLKQLFLRIVSDANEKLKNGR